ncbi:oligosaccharide flippase family protein [Nonomuraea rhodomycinica]|uniref:Oligosaccharide flippase family protein n=1 Tax=Nonomuraea rhodomycinica TaxID=1712872 RepID=A0A7Y6IVN8_9ACTN|nr:oligosaccharide flippase family protein [Nonomuraea rhodomycinica]NUW44923.1 oligosaccharide flippase family protein [Nonomuraea rhodomycinica]
MDETQRVAEIGAQAGRGLRWSILGNLVTRAGSFAMGLVLARVLAADDFGTYAVALAATQLVMHVKDVGIQAATVQWRGRLEDMAPTATVLSFVFATGLYGLFWGFAPVFARMAGNEDATGVVRLLTSIILIEAFTAVRSAALLRRFDQDKLTRAIMIGFVANAAVAITLALRGAGAYSFAWGQVAASVVTGVLIFVWGWVPVRLGLDRQVAGRLLRFGVPSALGFGLEAVLMNADYVVVGNVLGAEQLGYYLLAFNVSSWVPGIIGTALRYVSLPSFSRLAEDPAALSEGVRRSVPVMVTFVLPPALVMAVLAHPLISFLYGARWDFSAGVLRWLAVLMVVRMLISFLAVDILTGLGATRTTVWLNLVWAAALLPALVAGAHLGGIRGAAVAHALVAALVAVPFALFLLHRVGVRVAPALPALVRPAVAALAAGALMLVLDGLTGGGPALVRLAVAGGAGLLLFVLVAVPGTAMHKLVRRSA